MKQFHDAKVFYKTSIFRYSKNYGSLTHETIIKDAVNMEDLICLLATVRTLKRSYYYHSNNVCSYMGQFLKSW